MLAVTATAAVLLLTIIWTPTDGALRQRIRRDDTLTCGTSETKIYTPYIYNYNATNSSFCGSVVRQLPFDYYNSIFRAECQRWLGSPTLPDQVGLSQAIYCIRYPLNNTAVYQMAVCCPGTTMAVRCFTRTAPVESDNYGSNFHGTIETCAADQVCQTQYTFQGSACTVDRRVVTKGCATASNCQRAVRNGACTDHARTPICTTCCTSAFCNYGINEALTKLPGSCSSGNVTAPTACSPNPCNNGYCSGNTTSVTCSCRIGWTGTYCTQQITLCSANQCQNGGTCYDYLNGNYRCNCPTGFIGDDCQYTSRLTCRRSDVAYYEQVTETVFPTTCNDLAATAQQYSTAYLDICKRQMRVSGRPAFVNGVNGQVDRIDQFEPQYCRHGGVYAWYKMHMCCPACLSVPCLNGGWCNEVLTTNSYVCICPAGFSGLNCEHRVSLCIISGDPHYKTFDGQLLSYQGVCKHVLVEQTPSYNGSNPFQIYLRNEHRLQNSQVSFTKDVLVDLCGDNVEILRDTSVPGFIPITTKVNGLTVKLPYPGTCYSIEYNGQFVQLDSTPGLRIQFNGFWLVTIQVPDSYIGVTRGMCGNNNNNATDDLKTSNGTYVGGEEDPGRTIGNSYVVGNFSVVNETNCLHPPTNETCTDVDKQRRIADRCSVITDHSGVFGSCIDRVGLGNAQLFYSSCFYDACHFNESSICLSLEVFALECFLHGVQVTWRTATGCQLQCPVGMIPSDNTIACQPTCDNPLASRSCRWANTAMCVCPEGQILSNGQCVTCCGCVDSLGISHESGSQWTTPNCETFECTRVSSTSPFDVCTSNITIVTTSCPNGANCQNGECITTPTTTATTPTTTTPTTTTAEITTLTTTTLTTAPTSTPIATTMLILPPPPNITTCAIDAQAACSQCNFTVNPAGYVADPCKCTSFYQCVNFNGIWNAYQRPCPPCLCWDPVTLVCSNVANSTVPLTDPSCRPVTITTESPDANCALFSPASDPRFYIVKGLNQTMPCPSGTLFDSVTCRCLVDNRANSTISSRIFCLDFDNSNLLNGVFVSQINLNVSEFGFRGKSAYFNGNNAAIEVPALTNVQLSEFTVSLWFRRVGTNTGSQGLVDSSDCRRNGSIHVISADQSHVTANLLTTGSYVTVAAQSAAYDAWNHVALSYDGLNVRMYVNNVLVSTVPATGQTLPSSCPMLFGHYYTSDSPGLTDGWFNGYMDNICFYRKALTTSQINNLYNFITA